MEVVTEAATIGLRRRVVRTSPALAIVLALICRSMTTATGNGVHVETDETVDDAHLGLSMHLTCDRERDLGIESVPGMGKAAACEISWFGP